MSIVGIVIVLLGAMLLYHITGLRKNEYTKKEPLLLNWTVVSENQTDTDVDLNTFRFDNILTDKKTVYLSRTFVDKGQFQSPVLVVQTHNAALRVFVDGECIYSYGLERYDCGKMVGSGMHSIAMPKDGEQHELMLEFKANGDSYVTRMNDIYITDYATIYTDFLVTNRVTYALSVCLLFIGFVLLLLGMVMMLTRTWFTHLISLGIFSLMVGLWTMGKYNILQIYRVPIWLCTFIEYASMYIGPPSLLLFSQLPFPGAFTLFLFRRTADISIVLFNCSAFSSAPVPILCHCKAPPVLLVYLLSYHTFLLNFYKNQSNHKIHVPFTQKEHPPYGECSSHFIY